MAASDKPFRVTLTDTTGSASQHRKDSILKALKLRPPKAPSLPGLLKQEYQKLWPKGDSLRPPRWPSDQFPVVCLQVVFRGATRPVYLSVVKPPSGFQLPVPYSERVGQRFKELAKLPGSPRANPLFSRMGTVWQVHFRSLLNGQDIFKRLLNLKPLDPEIPEMADFDSALNAFNKDAIDGRVWTEERITVFNKQLAVTVRLMRVDKKLAEIQKDALKDLSRSTTGGAKYDSEELSVAFHNAKILWPEREFLPPNAQGARRRGRPSAADGVTSLSPDSARRQVALVKAVCKRVETGAQDWRSFMSNPTAEAINELGGYQLGLDTFPRKEEEVQFFAEINRTVVQELHTFFSCPECGLRSELRVLQQKDGKLYFQFRHVNDDRGDGAHNTGDKFPKDLKLHQT